MPVNTRRSVARLQSHGDPDQLPRLQAEVTRLTQSTNKKRTNVMSSSSEPLAATSSTKKKSKTYSAPSTGLSVETSSYNLRSSAHKQQSQVVATVTPANDTTTRRLAPSFETPPAHSDKGSIPGVVDIYDSRQPLCASPFSCNCPADRSFDQGTDLAFAHLAHYGKAFGEIMKAREQAENAQVLARLEERDLDEEDDEENKENCSRRSNRSDDSQSSSSAKYTPPPNSRTVFRDRTISEFAADESDDDSLQRNDPVLPRQPLLTTNMRTMLVNWMCEVSKEYKISDDALHLSITLVDRVLLMGPTEAQYYEDLDKGPVLGEQVEYFLVPKSSFQALGCACLMIASKLEDRSTPKTEDLCYISDNSFSERKLRLMEEDICRHLSFRLAVVTPMHFVNEFLRASHACPSRACQFDHAILRNVVLYLLTLSRLSYELSHLRPSLLAAASVYLARVTLGITEKDLIKRCHPENGYWTRTLQYYTGYSLKELAPVVHIIHGIQSTAEVTENYRGVYTYFAAHSRRQASLKTAVPSRYLGLQYATSSRDVLSELF